MRTLVALLLTTLLLGPATAKPLAALSEPLRAAVAREDMRVGVAIKDLNTGEEFLLHGDESFRQASSIKIHILTELYRQHAAGRLDVHAKVPFTPESRAAGSGLLKHMGRDTVTMSLRDYAVLMIVLSDNSATNLLIDRVGMDAVNAFLVAQGTPGIQLQRRMMDRAAVAAGRDNIATPREMMRSLELLHRGEVVDRTTSDEVLKILKIPRFGRPAIREPLPESVAVAHKGGSLSSGVRCDSAIIYLPGRPYVLCVMTEGRKDSAEGEEVIADVSRLAYQHFSEL